MGRGVGGPECTPPTVPAAPALARRAISYALPAGSRAFAAHRAIGCEKTRLPAGHRTCFPEVLFPKSRWISRSAAPTWLVGLACVASFRVLFQSHCLSPPHGCGAASTLGRPDHVA